MLNYIKPSIKVSFPVHNLETSTPPWKWIIEQLQPKESEKEMTNRKGVEDASSSGSENQRQGRSGGVSVGDLKPLQPSERIRRRKRPATQLLALRVRKVVRISPRKSKRTRQRDGTHFAYCSSSNCVFANGKNEHSNLGRE